MINISILTHGVSISSSNTIKKWSGLLSIHQILIDTLFYREQLQLVGQHKSISSADGESIQSLRYFLKADEYFNKCYA
jgi:hypothetical protein